jgi:hypothetical protein
MQIHESFGFFWEIPDTKRLTCKIYELSDMVGRRFQNDNGRVDIMPSDLEHDIHEGYVIGRGKTLYWERLWHPSGHVTVIPKSGHTYRRWISGDTEITLIFK